LLSFIKLIDNKKYQIYFILLVIIKHGDWGIGDWGLGTIPNPQSPIPKKYFLNKYQDKKNLLKYY
jgi:hypothetical protein